MDNLHNLQNGDTSRTPTDQEEHVFLEACWGFIATHRYAPPLTSNVSSQLQSYRLCPQHVPRFTARRKETRGLSARLSVVICIAEIRSILLLLLLVLASFAFSPPSFSAPRSPHSDFTLTHSLLLSNTPPPAPLLSLSPPPLMDPDVFTPLSRSEKGAGGIRERALKQEEVSCA